MLKKNRSLVLLLAVSFITILAVYFYYKADEPKVLYAPCATEASGLAYPSVEPSSEMEGSMEESELFIASPEGSRIFARGGLNYIVANGGPDEFYFSLCSAKIIDDQVSVIEGFDLQKDKLIFFCGHGTINPDQVRVIHDQFQGIDVTYVEVQGKHSVTAVALLGNIAITPNDVILNKPFKE